ncbi:hypothetical protein, partial [Burkholderia cepacia]|uniref:hypothetical protein n=1 Tax=Burkholderia cepacia TaxID=292 RepID=UPI001C3F3F13
PATEMHGTGQAILRPEPRPPTVVDQDLPSPSNPPPSIVDILGTFSADHADPLSVSVRSMSIHPVAMF